MRLLSAIFLSMVANWGLFLFIDKGGVEVVTKAFIWEENALARMTNDHGLFAGFGQAFLLNWLILGTIFCFLLARRFQTTKLDADRVIASLLSRR